jgi:SP family xylose:H+ symportor-like MFS transporter
LDSTVTNRARDALTTDFTAGYVLLITLSAASAALGGLLFGYDWVVIGGAKPLYERCFGLTSAQLMLGCLLGSVVSGALSDRIGRKKMLIAAAFLFAVSSILTGWSNTFDLFDIWRIVGGVASNPSPTYISEVSPAPWRGRLVAVYQLGIGTAVVAAQIANWLNAEGPEPRHRRDDPPVVEWSIRMALDVQRSFPALVFFLGALFLPESPRWLALKGNVAQARNTLSKIGGASYAEEALLQIRETAASDFGGGSSLRELFRPHIAKIATIGVALAVLQQFCGIHVICNYAEEIYRAAGYVSQRRRALDCRDGSHRSGRDHHCVCPGG